MVCSGTQWYAVVFNSVQWYSMVCNGTQWYAVVFNGVQWYSMVSSASVHVSA